MLLLLLLVAPTPSPWRDDAGEESASVLAFFDGGSNDESLLQPSLLLLSCKCPPPSLDDGVGRFFDTPIRFLGGNRVALDGPLSLLPLLPLLLLLLLLLLWPALAMPLLRA